MNTANRIRPLGIALATAGIVLTSLLGANSVAQAAPPRHAPAHGYYKNKDKGDKHKRPDRDHHWDRDRDRRDRDHHWDRDRDRRDRDRRDRDRNNRPWNYNRNDNPLRNNFYGRNRTLSGVVTRGYNGDKFEFRADDGHTYLVEFYNRSQAPRGLSVGDRITVYGDVQGRNLAARNVRILRNR